MIRPDFSSGFNSTAAMADMDANPDSRRVSSRENFLATAMESNPDVLFRKTVLFMVNNQCNRTY